MISTDQVVLTKENIPEYVQAHAHLLSDIQGEKLHITPLKGGIVNWTFSVEGLHQGYIFKQALSHCKSMLTCEMDPARIHKEYEAITIFSTLSHIPVFPQLVFLDKENFILIFKKQLENPTHLRDELLQGNADPALAAILGRTIAQMHNATRHKEEIRKTFDNEKMFREIKVGIQCINITKDEQLKKEIVSFLDTSLLSKEVLLHGDLAPKNVLLEDKRILLIDYEESSFGDPALDVGYLLAHYYLYALLHKQKNHFFTAILSFYNSYTEQAQELSDSFEQNVLTYIGIFMLSRVDGEAKEKRIPSFLHESIRRLSRKLITQKISFTTLNSEMSDIPESSL